MSLRSRSRQRFALTPSAPGKGLQIRGLQ